MTHYTQEVLAKIVTGYSTNKKLNLKKVLAHLDPNDSDDYHNWQLFDEVIEENIKCACSQDIYKVHKLVHKETGYTISVGSECIKKFSPELKHQVNRILALHKQPNNKYCKHCDKKVRDSVVEQYPDKNEFYHKTCLNACFDKCYTCYKHKEYDCLCVYAKCKLCPKMLNLTIEEPVCENCILNRIPEALAFKMKYGKYTGISLGEMLKNKEQTTHLIQLYKSTNSEIMKTLIKRACYKL